jgi:hypothetical protein
MSILGVALVGSSHLNDVLWMDVGMWRYIRATVSPALCKQSRPKKISPCRLSHMPLLIRLVRSLQSSPRGYKYGSNASGRLLLHRISSVSHIERDISEAFSYRCFPYLASAFPHTIETQQKQPCQPSTTYTRKGYRPLLFHERRVLKFLKRIHSRYPTTATRQIEEHFISPLHVSCLSWVFINLKISLERYLHGSE